MKSLEEVIKYKLNFLPLETEPFYAIQTYTAERGTDPPPSFYDIYRTKNPIFSNDSYSFIEDITPLFIYISSCDKYYRENGHGKIGSITIKSISEDYKVLEYGLSNTFDDLDEHRISKFKEHRNFFFLFKGYCRRFTKPFRVSFTGGFKHFRTEEEELQYEAEIREYEEAYYRQEAYYTEQGYYREGGSFIGENDDESEEEEEDTGRREEFPINDFKTFKGDQCVICLEEEEPKVLFCNCGHLCICKKCASHRYDNCPVCKKGKHDFKNHRIKYFFPHESGKTYLFIYKSNSIRTDKRSLFYY